MRTPAKTDLVVAVILLMAAVLCTLTPAVAQTGVEAAAANSAAVAPGSASTAALPQVVSAAQQPAPPPSNAPQEVVPSGSAPVQVTAGKSILITTQDRLKRVSVTNPEIADAIAVTPNQVLVHGRTPGEVSLVIWNEAEQSRTFDLRVEVDVSPVTEDIQRIFPREHINVSSARGSLVLSGHVATKEDADRAGAVAAAFSKSVVNVLEFGPVGAEEVLLEVHFAEVNRTALSQLGVNLFSTGAGNTIGATSTQQFAPFSGSNLGSIPKGISPGTIPNGSNIINGGTGSVASPQPASFGTNNLLNIFLFRSDINLGAIIQALQQKNVLQVLAEPNLISVNGKEASFLAGGEFPYPVSQGISGAVTIQWKEFGVRLKFVPLIMPNGNIHLQVAPEVSALDFTNGLTVSGFAVPGLSTRRAQTEVELRDGQSFVIAGLLDNRLTDAMSKMPGISSIPVLGNLFKSKSLQKSTDELMVMVTARRISPSMQLPPLPKYPEPFLDQKKTTESKPNSGQ